jgi:non-ribosomal peptide synthetase-like protein
VQKTLLPITKPKKLDSNQEFVNDSLLKNECLHHIFEETVDRFPQNIAVVCDSNSIMYRELEEYANQLASYLRKKGVQRGSKVAILLERSIEQYVAILGINKAGACYVPLDVGYPQDRISYIIGDCNIDVLITVSPIWDGLTLTCQDVLLMDQEKEQIKAQPPIRLSQRETHIHPSDLSYIIYTSGSTGRPKGVMIEHKSVSHLVRASQEIYGVHQDDRIYQGFTIAFDASIEEIWLAFASGGSLIEGTQEWIESGSDLPKLLTEAGVTVLSCVPTLLTMWEEDIPTLKLLIVGGEACPKQLVDRWAKPGRRMMNTYGPTEATVIATYTECKLDKPVTIGRPIPNYSVYILDEDNKEVPKGQPGELHIGGPGLARGYVNNEQLTNSKFIYYETSRSTNKLLYKTGDLVRFNDQDELEFLGRIDNQVKLRGYRVELSEIEEVILKFNNIQNAIAHVQENTSGMQVLVAYIVTKTEKKIDRKAFMQYLKEQLPSYMIPTHIEEMSTMPLLVSGKVDRNKLPPISKMSAIHEGTYIAPSTKLEKTIAGIWLEVFHRDTISIDNNFFKDLGGHSLFAALVTSKLRKHSIASHLSISHIYQYPTIRDLAEFLKENPPKKPPSLEKKSENFVSKKPVSSISYRVAGFIQGISIYFQYFIFTLPFLIPYLYVTTNSEWSLETLLLVIGIAMLLYYPLIGILSVSAKWILIGRYQHGMHPLWGSFYLRWWIVSQIQSLMPQFFLTGTPFLNLYYRLLGAKIGKNVYLGSHQIHSFDLISIGENTSIGVDAQLLGYTIKDGHLIIGSIEVGSNCFIGSNAIMSPDVKMENGSQLAEQSMISESGVIPANERWIGSPARKSKEADSKLNEIVGNLKSPTTILPNTIMYIGFIFCVLLINTTMLISFLPTLFLSIWLFPHWGPWQLLLSPIYSALFTVMLFVQIFILKYMLSYKIKQGVYELRSFFYLKKWLLDRLLSLTLVMNNSLYATLYILPFLRMLGAKIGKRAEVSTVMNISPDLLDIGNESFIADAASIGTSKVYLNRILVADTKIGNRTFIGNSAHIEGGQHIGNNSLLGVLSVPPEKEQMTDHTSWLGSPAIFLPRRDVNTCFSETATYRPTTSLLVARYLIEFFRVTLPGAFTLNMLWLWLYVLNQAVHYLSYPVIFVLSPILSGFIAIAATGVVVFFKKLLIGRYKPIEKPLWSNFVWRSELITALYENVTVPTLIRPLLGTPYIRYVLKLFGVKIGKRVYLESTHFTEFDLVTIKDGAMINANSTIQSHLFEDRVMKMSVLTIGSHCSIGNGSVVLYDTKMNDHATLGNLSLLMKGETLPAHTHWEGAPAQSSKHI